MEFIDLRSDTVTRPTPAMLDAMFSARVGDDVFGEDPAVNELEATAALLFGMEAAIFCPSGTMTNQIAVKVHTQPGDEVICDRLSHIYNYEGGGIAFHSGASVRLMNGDRGRFSAREVRDGINPDDVHHPVTRLVAVENTCNRGGGSIFPLGSLKEIHQVCHDYHLSFHLDGARLFNALTETGETPEQYGKLFHTISICLSKGLGAPVGSLLLGSASMIRQARRIRKLLGGGMRQAGFMAAAGLHALRNNVNRLKDDHARARQLERILSRFPFIESVLPVETNIVVGTLAPHIQRDQLIHRLREKGILVVAFGPDQIRMVTHLDITDAMIDRVEHTLNTLKV